MKPIIEFSSLSRQYLNLREEILEATNQVLKRGHVIWGENCSQFEAWLCEKNHVSHAVACHSGTQALEIIAQYLKYTQLVDQPRVLLPVFGCTASTNAFLRSGWRVCFADVDQEGNLDINVDLDLHKINLVCLIGLHGSSVAGMQSKLSTNGVCMIEDAAQHWLSRSCQRVGIAQALSFSANKNLCCFGSGGAVLTDDPDLAKYARAWCNYRVDHIGTSSSMSELDCAHVLVKCAHIDEWQQRRQEIARYWIEQLDQTNARCLVSRDSLQDHGLFKFVVDCGSIRDSVHLDMISHGIETRITYPVPFGELNYYSKCEYLTDWPQAKQLATGSLCVPIYPELTDLEVEYIIDQLRDCVSGEHS